MLNLSILDYPDHADPVKRLTEHLVNKVVSAKSCSLPLWQFSKRSNAAVSNTASMCLARDLLSSFWRRGDRATTRLSTSTSTSTSSSTGAIKTATALPLRSWRASGCDSPGLLNKPAARLRTEPGGACRRVETLSCPHREAESGRASRY